MKTKFWFAVLLLASLGTGVACSFVQTALGKNCLGSKVFSSSTVASKTTPKLPPCHRQKESKSICYCDLELIQEEFSFLDLHRFQKLELLYSIFFSDFQISADSFHKTYFRSNLQQTSFTQVQFLQTIRLLI